MTKKEYRLTRMIRQQTRDRDKFRKLRDNVSLIRFRYMENPILRRIALRQERIYSEYAAYHSGVLLFLQHELPVLQNRRG